MLSSSRGHRLVCGGSSGLDGPQRTAQFNDSNTTDGVACQLEHMKQPSLYGYHTRLANCTPIFKYQRQQDLWSSMQPTVMIETPKASTNHRWFCSIVVYSHLDGWAYWRADKPYYISLEYVVKWSEPRYDWLGIVRLSPPDLAYHRYVRKPEGDDLFSMTEITSHSVLFPDDWSNWVLVPSMFAVRAMVCLFLLHRRNEQERVKH